LGLEANTTFEQLVGIERGGPASLHARLACSSGLRASEIWCEPADPIAIGLVGDASRAVIEGDQRVSGIVPGAADALRRNALCAPQGFVHHEAVPGIAALEGVERGGASLGATETDRFAVHVKAGLVAGKQRVPGSGGGVEATS